jgi:hypothetical protein
MRALAVLMVAAAVTVSQAKVFLMKLDGENHLNNHSKP